MTRNKSAKTDEKIFYRREMKGRQNPKVERIQEKKRVGKSFKSSEVAATWVSVSSETASNLGARTMGYKTCPSTWKAEQIPRHSACAGPF